MGRLIRMDRTGHTTLAEWTAGDEAAVEAAAAAFRQQLDAGYYAVVSEGEGQARQVRELPADAELVILRRPIAGGGARRRGGRLRPRGRPPAGAPRAPVAPAGRRRVAPHAGPPVDAEHRRARH